jgi:hypothetical protein
MARNMPQPNHFAEQGFAHLTNLGRALIMNRAHIPLKCRYKLFAKAFKTATLLNGLHIIEIDGKVATTRYKHWCRTNPKFMEHLPQTWDKAGTLNLLKDKSTPKVADQGWLVI